jgi:transposase
MLKIMIYANIENIYSSRDIERACHRDINFIWLLNGSKAPNHFEIARFRSQRLSKCGEELFYEIVKKLYEEEEIRYEHLFVDGTKIEANANKYSFV